MYTFVVFCSGERKHNTISMYGIKSSRTMFYQQTIIVTDHLSIHGY